IQDNHRLNLTADAPSHRQKMFHQKQPSRHGHNVKLGHIVA
ncbi:hypothetical protein EC940618_3467, partial [Escherichia coli 94.0618]